jgi:hypothetical protein
MYTDFLLQPATGSFDIDDVEDLLAALPITVRDEQVPNKFMLCDDRWHARHALEARRTSPSFPASVALVQITPHEISASYLGGGKRPLRAFVKALAAMVPLVYQTETFVEIAVDPALDALFGVAE